MGTPILLASVLTMGLACLGFLMYGVVRLTNLSWDEKEAMAKGKMSRHAWRRQSAHVIGVNTLAFFGSLVVLINGVQTIGERIGQRDNDARATQYEACLKRTNAEVCEIHWVRLPQPRSNDDGVSLVITPSGKIGIGLNP